MWVIDSFLRKVSSLGYCRGLVPNTARAEINYQPSTYVETRRPSGSAVAYGGKHSFSAASAVAYGGKAVIRAGSNERVSTHLKFPPQIQNLRSIGLVPINALTEPY